MTSKPENLKIIFFALNAVQGYAKKFRIQATNWKATLPHRTTNLLVCDLSLAVNFRRYNPAARAGRVYR